MKRVFSILFFVLSVLPRASAQLYSLGDEQGSLRWKEIRSANYRVVFPEGSDSLAKEYAKTLELNRPAVGASIGFLPNEAYRKPMPVILHPNTCKSNGVVTWSPRRMELLCTPSASPLSSMTNVSELAVHESRHVAQMQLGAAKPYRWLRYVSGELWVGAMSALYPGPTILEGDAVVAETELSKAGRGRSASFLKYYDACFAAGDWRDFYRWSWGSQRNYTPDYYRAGYFTIAGIRAYYDSPDFSRNYFRGIGEGWPLPFFYLQKTVRAASGKNFRETFKEISVKQEQAWQQESMQRAPFTPTERITKGGGLYESFTESTTDGKRIWSIRSGLDRTSELVETDHSGKIRRLMSISPGASRLSWYPEKKMLLWSETITDARWSLKSYSVLKYRTEDGRTGSLTKGTRFFNPRTEDDVILVTEYPVEGGSAIVILDPESGKVIRRIKAPGTLQVLECGMTDGKIYCSCLGEKGQGIYDSHFRAVLEPEYVSIRDFTVSDGKIFFSSDRNGSDEFYSLDPVSGKTVMLTSTRFGGSDYFFLGDSLYFSAVGASDKAIYAIANKDLRNTEVDFHTLYRSPVAEKLSAQASCMPRASADTTIGEARPYNRLRHLFKFHSWIPAYVDTDALESLTLSNLQSAAGLGATAFFHNDLNSFSGSIAYSAWNHKSGWRSSGHAKFKYSGLYPVIEASVDIGNRDSHRYFFNSPSKDTLFYSKGGNALAEISLRTYVPLNFSSGGWNRGVVPQIQYSFRSDVFCDENGGMTGFHTLSASFRAYSVQAVASSCIYPRWGIGAEIGGSIMPGLRELSTPLAYARIYGYLPGIIRTHGIRLEALGYSSIQGYLSFTYAFPFAAVDWSLLSPVAYIRNFEFYAKARLSNRPDAPTQFGGEIVARLGNLLWIPYDTRIGVSVNYCPAAGKKPLVGFVFSVNM